jgi:DNA-binding LacI/PurR family transcriptional regulator
MTRIDDVAREVSMSTATVSRALRGLQGVSDENRTRILEAARRLGYVPSPSAVGLASGRTGIVAMIVADITSWRLAQMVSGAADALRAGGYDALLYDLAGRATVRKRILRAELLAKRADGVLVLGTGATPEERAVLVGLGRPVAVVEGFVESRDGTFDLTSAARSFREQGRYGAERVLADLAGVRASDSTVLPVGLVARCRRPRCPAEDR